MQKHSISVFPFVTAALLCVLVTACKKDPPFPITDPTQITGLQDSIQLDSAAFMAQLDSITREQCQTFDHSLDQLVHYTTPPPIEQTTLSTTIDSSGGYLCITIHVKWAPEFNELYLTSPVGSIQPGQLYDGNGFAIGNYKLIQANRDSIRISISLPTQPGADAGIWIKNPNSIAEARNAINELLRRVTPGATPAYINFEIKEVRASEEVDLHLGANFSGWGAKIKGSYDFNESTRKTKILVRYQQIYYTIDADPVISPCQLFKPIPTAEEAQNIFAGSSPVYVASVNYGRAVYYMIESDSSFQNVKKALDLTFSKWGVDAHAELDHTITETLSNSSIQALLVGGSADGAVKSINGLEQLKQFIIEGADFSADNNLGVPLSYKMKFISDGSDAKIVLASDYNIRNCEAYSEQITLSPQVTDYYFCAKPTGTGDREFGGHGPAVNGSFKLKHDEGKIYLILHCNWRETVDDFSEAGRDEIIHLLTLPPGQVFAGFGEADEASFNYTDTNHDVDQVGLNGGSFISNLRIVGDTSGDDMDCNGDEDANIRFQVNPIKILVRPQ